MLLLHCPKSIKRTSVAVWEGTSLRMHFREFPSFCCFIRPAPSLLVLSEINFQGEVFSPRPMNCGEDTVLLELDQLLHSGLLCCIQEVGAST